jgi:hypothetical protein
VGYDAVLRRLADRHGYRVAEVGKLMRAARAAGGKLLEDDQVHLTQEGYRVMTRAVLDGLGFQDVPVPRELKVEPMPGLVREWKIRPIPEAGTPLTEDSVRALNPDAGWKSFTLPEQEPVAHWWMDQERRRGFAVALDKKIGPAKAYQGVATLDEKRARKAYVNTGGQLEAVWVNGRRVYKNAGWTGWHAGKERVPVELKPGRNTVVIETGGQFFLSLTEDNTW